MGEDQIYIFLDERIEKTTRGERLLILSFSVLKNNWSSLCNQTSHIVSVGLDKRLEEIQVLLEKVKGLAIITYGDIPREILPKREIDGTNDIPRMSRRDHIWANAIIFNLAYTFGLLSNKASSFLEQIEIYHDPKNLTIPLRTALQNFIHDKLANFPKQKGFQNKFYVSKISEVSKASNFQSADLLQLGTSIADHLGHQAQNLILTSTLPSRIKVLNQSNDILKSLKNFLHECIL
ncbi:MAG: hypothetical protein A3I11_01255 [Elusimicrobia bacterium RIFCSPLOWO2_02_FULL_39_32]|nr:MAG: hypothetical protein A2034_05850 [Elusimicrobia bacterium GWA2_38_7]OGR78179.1 MAG: hypothetical protein A3B80_05740 [Elusimicrobia bacterium RIFCSPHIGHO2_02_FULL_39_36]OGR92316.1 MAG: hypothetical protein A3I11_01255 [Elusimicrobia bacterium RIFCSPLOWO2_02_FULL_39_32]